MAQPTWSFLQNRFDNVTKRNFRRMYLMSTDHFDKLAARSTDPDIAALYILGKPAFDAFTAQYVKNGTDASNYQMHTLRVENQLNALRSTLIRKWDVRIQNIFDANSPEYLSLLPNGRGPFQSGAYDLRISAVRSLAHQLAQYPALSSLQVDVDTFHAQFLTARSTQQGVENLDQDNSDELEDARFALAQVMFAIFAGLISLYYTNLSKVETFYELKYFRRISDNSADEEPELSEEVTIAKGASATALVGQLTIGRTVRVTNIGAAVLTVYGAPDGNTGTRPNQVYTVSAGQDISFEATASDSLVLLLNEVDPFDGKALVELL